jgi:hypothetical protein
MAHHFSLTAIVFFAAAAFLGSCTEKPVDGNVQHVPAWKTVILSSSEYYQGFLNSFTDSSGLYVYHPNGITLCKKQSDSEPLSLSHHLFTYTLPSRIRYSLCSRYFTSYIDKSLRIGTMSYPDYNSAGRFLWMPSLDSGFYRFHTLPLVFGNSIGINNSNTVLAVYQYYNSDAWGVAALLVHLTEGNPGMLDTISTKVIRLNQAAEVGTIQYFFDHYFVATTKTMRISMDGAVTTCFPRAIYSMFRVGADLYGMSFGKVVISKDAGVTWSEIGEVNYALESMQFVQADNEVFALNDDRIFHVVIGDSVMTVEEIDNDGLSTHWITSLNRYYNEMYVISLSGIFSRPIQSFYSYKPSTKRSLIR